MLDLALRLSKQEANTATQIEQVEDDDVRKAIAESLQVRLSVSCRDQSSFEASHVVGEVRKLSVTATEDTSASDYARKYREMFSSGCRRASRVPRRRSSVGSHPFVIPKVRIRDWKFARSGSQPK